MEDTDHMNRGRDRSHLVPVDSIGEEEMLDLFCNLFSQSCL